MDVLILSQYYEPEPIPKPHDLAIALAAKGHRTHVITGFPNYPGGVLYGGYKLALFRRETIQEIPVLRTYEYPYHGRNIWKRMLNYGSFMLSAPLGCLRARRADVMYVWHPPLTIGVAAWLIARLRRIPFVYDVQDIWPESAVLSGLMSDGPLVRLMSRLERFVYRRADHILVVTEGARENLISKGVRPERVTAMPHWIDETLFAAADESLREQTRAEFGWTGRFVVLFAGNHGLVQGLTSVIEAAPLLRDTNVRLAFVGDGSEKQRLVELAEKIAPAGIVEFIDFQPIERMPALMGAADALLVHLRRSELSKYVVPSKTMAYLAAGRPIVMAMEGAAAELIQSSGGGIVIPPEDPTRLVSTILELQAMSPEERQAMGARGTTYLRAHFSKSAIIERCEGILRRMAEGA